MKKVISLICIVLLVVIEIFVPLSSYAKENEKSQNVVETKNETNKEENKVDETKNVNEEQNKASNEVENNVNKNTENENIVKEEKKEDSSEELEENEVQLYSNEIQPRMSISGSEVIVNGTTNRITTKLSGRAVGTDGGSNANGADINLWDDVSVSQQRFIFQYNEEGYYTIVIEKSNKLLQVSEDGKKVEQWEEKSTDNQKWVVQDAGNGYYNIISKLNGKYLTVNGTGANCDLLCVANKTGKDNQKFQIVEKGTPKGEKTVEEGTYKIVLANAPTQSLTVDGGKKEDGANVHIWEYQKTLQQQFKLEYDGKGYYEIIPMHSGKRLDVVGYGNEANVDQWSENGGNDNQKWVIRKSASGNYNIISKRDAMYLDAYQSKTANGTNIEVYEQSRGAGQEFKLEKIEEDKNEEDEIVDTKTVEEGTYKIVLANAPQQSLTVDGGKTADGANVHIWKYVDSLQQQFNLVYDGNGYYEIIPLNSGKRLDVVGYGNESDVDQWSNNGGNDNQKWAIRKSASGNYNIVSQREGLYLDAYQSKTANGTKIQVYEKSGGAGQEFKLEKIGDKSERTVADGTYKIAPQANTNIVVEASASNTDNNGRIQIWQDYNVKAQKFNIEYIDGYYKIAMGHSGKSLTVKNKNIASGTEVVQYEWNEWDSQKWIIRQNEDGSVGIIPLSNYSLTLDIKGPIENGSVLELYNNEKNVKQRFSLIKSNIGVNIDTNKYPGIGEAVDKLVEEHPNWQFEILYTGLDFNTAVQGEYDYAGRTANQVDLSRYSGEWIAENPVVIGGWASASYKAIAYYMDPRNILNDVDVFQFVDLADYLASGATLDSIQYQVNETFLNDYAEDVRSACESQNINPYYIIARLLQEQGKNGSDTIYMDGGDGKKYFNPFNINAIEGDEVKTALAKAKQEGWDTMKKGIEGGIKFIKKEYLDAHQNTLYLNKFDVNPASPGGFYTHQYMQNLSAAYSEARIFRGAYEDTGTLDNNIKFIIPVYENMPTKPSEIPRNEVTSSGPISVQVTQTDMGLALRSEPSTQGGDSTLVGGRLPTGTQLISIERLDNRWHKVITLDGRMGYCSGDYLNIIDDITNCNDRVIVDTNDNIGTNVRTEPGTDQSYILKAVVEGSTGIRIMKDVYYADGHSWDIVIFDDGTRGFVATDYLKVI